MHNLLQGMRFRQSLLTRLMVTLKDAVMYHWLMTWERLKLFRACFAEFVPSIHGDIILTSSWFFSPGVCAYWIWEAALLRSFPKWLAN